MAFKRNLIIVCDETTDVAASYLMQLISLKDDKDDVVVGCPDGTVKAEKWNEKDFLNNQAKITSEQYFIFIGENKASKSVIPNIELKYNQYTIKYGWLGTRGCIYLPEKGEISQEDYKSFIEVAKAESAKKYKGLVEDIAKVAPVIPFVGQLVGMKYCFDKIKERKQISEQLYKYAVLHFYLNDLSKFLNL